MASLLVAGAMVAAVVGGTLTAHIFMARRSRALRQKALKRSWQGGVASAQEGGMAGIVLASVARGDQARTMVVPDRLAGCVRAGAAKLGPRLCLAGMPEASPEAAALWRVRAAAMGAACGALMGAILSSAAAAMGLFAGALGGWTCLDWALGQRIAARSNAIEGHVSEAIEVLCLGLRAGLSFERSLELYCANFPTNLSGELSAAQQMWGTGLLTREQALRNLSAAYDSTVLGRVIDSIVRSLRFGSPLASSLEDLAVEARQAHRAHVEEAVMKAPVKMMVPIGLLILPSMLLLVMGPIMLELVEGF